MPPEIRDRWPERIAPARADVGIGWRHPHYREVLTHLPAVDFLEVHSENFFGKGGAALSLLDEARSHYPVSLHGVGLSLGSAVGIDPWHLEQLAVLVSRIDPVRVSDHASFARATYKESVIHASDLLPIPFTPEALEVLSNNVDRVQNSIQRRFAVENLSAYIRWQDSNVDDGLLEVEFLNTLVRRTGCLLLVDVNNIYVNALNAHLQGRVDDPEAACRAWLDSVAPESVGEIHLAGHNHVQDSFGEIVIDDHGSRVCPAVWRLYRHAIGRFGLLPTLIEWDTDVPQLGVLLEEVSLARGICDDLQGRTSA
jgi:uncharacterized protein (UPF0276 family)